MKKIKKISLVFVMLMLVFALKSVKAATQDTAWNDYKNLSSGTTANYYVGETVKKTFKVNVKKTSVSTSLDSSVNDVKKIVSVSDTKTQVLYQIL